VATLQRLLAATGYELALVTGEPDLLARRGQDLEQVLHLAEALPFRRPGPLRYPRVPT
jgi:hypothetical protein